MKSHTEDMQATKDLQDAELQLLRSTLSELTTQHRQEIKALQSASKQAASIAKQRESELTAAVIQVCGKNDSPILVQNSLLQVVLFSAVLCGHDSPTAWLTSCEVHDMSRPK